MTFDKTFTANKEQLIKSLRKASVINTADKSSVEITFTEENALIHAVSDSGECHDEVDGKLTGSPIVTRFTTRFLIDAIERVTRESIVLQLNEALNPCAIKEDEYTAIVMPVRQ